jgi:hypothetical protein
VFTAPKVPTPAGCPRKQRERRAAGSYFRDPERRRAYLRTFILKPALRIEDLVATKMVLDRIAMRTDCPEWSRMASADAGVLMDRVIQQVGRVLWQMLRPSTPIPRIAATCHRRAAIAWRVQSVAAGLCTFAIQCAAPGIDTFPHLQLPYSCDREPVPYPAGLIGEKPRRGGAVAVH